MRTIRLRPHLVCSLAFALVPALAAVPVIAGEAPTAACTTAPPERSLLSSQTAPAPRDPAFAPPPGEGAAVELVAHRLSGVVSVSLSNGIRIHHRWMPPPPAPTTPPAPVAMAAAAPNAAPAQPSPRLVITVLIPGGEMLEPADQRGLCEAAITAWRTPAAAPIASERFKATLSAAHLDVSALALPDALILKVQAADPPQPPDPLAVPDGAALDQFQTMLGAVRLLISEPTVEPSALEAAQAELRSRLASLRTDRDVAVMDRVLELITPKGGDRFRFPFWRDPPRFTPQQAQAWLRQQIAGPLEISVVGPIRFEDAVAQSKRYLGTLPPRQTVSTSTLEATRFAPAAPGPYAADSPAPAVPAGSAFVARGFLAADHVDLREQRAIALGAAVLKQRAAPALGLEPAPQPAPGARDGLAVWYTPGRASPPGLGLLLCAATVAEDQATATSDQLQHQIALIAQQPIPPAQLEPARAKMLEHIHLLLADPAYWSVVLAASTYRGYDPDQIAAVADDVSRCTAEQVQSAWRKYAAPEREISVVLRAPPPGKPQLP